MRTGTHQGLPNFGDFERCILTWLGIGDCSKPNARPDDVSERLQAAVEAAVQGESNELQTIDSAVDSVIGQIDAALATGKSIGLTTRLSTLDRETGGFFPGELTVLAARPSIGKSAFAWILQRESPSTASEFCLCRLKCQANRLRTDC